MGGEGIRLYLTNALDAIEVRIFRVDDRRIGVRERFRFGDEGVKDADQMVVPLVAAVQCHLALQSGKRERLLDRVSLSHDASAWPKGDVGSIVGAAVIAGVTGFSLTRA
jgi:hypothetical protein